MSEFAKTKAPRCNDYRNKRTEKYSVSHNKFFQCSNESNSRHVRSIRFTMQKLSGTPTGNLTCCCILFVTSSHCIRDKRLSFFIKKLIDRKKTIEFMANTGIAIFSPIHSCSICHLLSNSNLYDISTSRILIG